MQPIKHMIYLGIGLCLCFGGSAIAALKSEGGKGKLSSAQQDLKKTQQELESAKKRQENLKEKASRAQKDMEPLQRALVAQAKDLREVEQDLLKLEREAQSAQKRVSEKETDLKQRREEIAGSLDAMVRLRKMPTEALIARPGKLKDTITAAQLLQHLSEQLQQSAAELQQELNALAEAQQELAEAKVQVEQKRQSLLAKREDLQDQLEHRSKLFQSVNQEYAQMAARVTQLGKQSRSLQDLLEKLSAQESKPQFIRAGRANRAGATLAPVRSRAFLLPVAGKVLASYGDDGARGVRLQGASDGSVVAPYDGEVVFTGPFLDYGRMVILRHAGGYHSLMAGMSQITVSPGQRTQKGEPIGRLGKRLSDAQLYLEFRENNKPVDPSRWFAGL